MTTDARTCPRCKRMVEPELRDGVAVWRWHGTLTLSGRNTMRPCSMAGRPIKERRTKLGHQIQKATNAAGHPDVKLPADPFEGFRD